MVRLPRAGRGSGSGPWLLAAGICGAAAASLWLLRRRRSIKKRFESNPVVRICLYPAVLRLPVGFAISDFALWLDYVCLGPQGLFDVCQNRATSESASARNAAVLCVPSLRCMTTIALA